MAIPSLKALKRQSGATTVEFYVLAFYVLFPLIMAVMQMGLLIVAKNTVNLATFTAARAGAASGGDQSEMKRGLLNALSPLYVARGLGALGGSGLRDVSNGNFTTVMSAAYASAAIDWALHRRTNSLTVLNPTKAAFKDFAIQNPHTSGRVIPVTNLMNDMSVGSSSGETRADALLLKIEVRYCYKMIFPVIDVLVGTILKDFSSGGDKLCYESLGIPIVSQAVIRMTTPPVESNF
ncbi:TadE family protein [Undibacterium sp. CY21W]|uniref:TadE family protein n=1 Tax=Undibacterium sp. CY21W TaxID=2762293 RepID=UPI00164B0FDB|nr:TadE family protein [Undibacterium sp. CY21W]MBC3927419.1 pilus assembly protein [Undibacterium sp. CY21W]